jgi:hypothetical protein
MKKIVLLLTAFLLLAATAFAQDGKTIYQRYSDEENVSAVYISPAMFRLFGVIPDIELDGSNVNLSNVIRSLTSLYVLNSRNERINDNLRADTERYIKRGEYELLMEAKDSGETVRMYTVGDDEVVKNFVMLAAEPGETTFISFEGLISRADFERLIQDAMND